ncbi:AT-rich interactive domain-containing protein 4B-like [Rhopalosiphum maidis]|uniref:AT-rich interactive domain-containing protein 4B-like n=1 Tax=Rhopalosiphum maidis TaxID=43146 RepID=UPI000EFF81E9|nr:AT-rich interactive domain-containing protein 4B-like [Rhopalosiphum maidis]
MEKPFVQSRHVSTFISLTFKWNSICSMVVYSDEPLILAVGTEVCIKSKGVFCEAKIEKISENYKCKVQQYADKISKSYTGRPVKGQLKVGANIALRCQDTNDIVQGKILKVQDYSEYTVAFYNGDIACFKRKSISLKSKGYFANSTNLDQLPFNNPEHSDVTHDVQDCRSQEHKKDFGEIREEEALASEEKDIGKVVCVVTSTKKKLRDNWFPGLIVAPTSQSSIKTNFVKNRLVRSFKDGKYYTVPKNEITEFTKEIGARVENPTLKTAVKKANCYLDNDELPPHWDRDFLFGVETTCTTTYDGNNSDEEPIEEKDHFVAQLIKFMDDRGTPLNQAPMIDEKDVDLYKLFKVVNNCGGYNKVDKDNQWLFVSIKAGYERQSSLSVKNFYQKFLHGFENFYRKLGCTMLSHPRKVRSRSSFSRSIIRDIDKTLHKKSVKIESNNKKVKDFTRAKKVAKAIKVIKNNTSCNNKQLVKCDSNIVKLKNPIKNVKTKNELENILRKEIDTDTLEDHIIEDTKVKSELLGTRKRKADEVQIKTFLSIMPAFKKSKRGVSYYQQDVSNTGKSDDVPKTTEKKKNVRKKKSDKVKTSNNNATVFNIKVETFNKNTLVVVGDHLLVYYNQNQLYEAKVLKMRNIDGVMKYYIHYTGWNLRYDEWIDILRIGFKIIGLVQGPDGHNNIDSSKISPTENTEKIKTPRKKKYDEEKISNNNTPTLKNIKDEPYDDEDDMLTIIEDDITVYNRDYQAITDNAKQTNWDKEKMLSTTSRTRRSVVTPIKSYSLRTKTPYSSTRPRRTCTLTKSYFDNSDSETEYTVKPVESFKQYNKKKTIKTTEPDVIRTEPLDTNNHKKNKCLKTYSNKKAKSSVFKIHDNISEEIEICKQVILKPSFDLNFMIPSQSYDIKSNADNEGVDVQNESKIDNNTIIEPTFFSNHNLSPKKKTKNNFKKLSEFSKNRNEEIEIKAEQLTMTKKSEIFNTINYSLSSEVEKQNELEKITEVISCPLDDKSDKSGSDFYLNKIKSDMKEPMPISTNSNNDIIQETNILNQQLEIEVSKSDELITDDDYEFKEFKSCSFDIISSDIDSSKLSNIEKLNELPRVIDSSAQLEVVENNSSIIPFVPTIYSMNSYEIKVNDKLNNLNEMDDSITHDKSDVPDIKDQILDLSIKPFKPSPNDVCIFPSEFNDYAIKEEDVYDDDDDDDDDESRLVIVEEPDYQSDEDIDQSLPPVPSSIPLHNTSLIDTDDESNIYYDESIQNVLISSFKMSPHSKSYDDEVENVEKSIVLPLQFREKIVDADYLNNALVIENNHYVSEYDIHKPSTSKGLFNSIGQPGISKDTFYETNTRNDAKNSFLLAEQTVNNINFNTNVPCKSNLFNHNIPSTSKYSFYDNSMPSTSKQFYNPESNVSNILYEETILDSSTSMPTEQLGQEETIKIFGKFNNNEIEAILGMCAMSQSCQMPMVIMANATEKKTKEDTNNHQK